MRHTIRKAVLTLAEAAGYSIIKSDTFHRVMTRSSLHGAVEQLRAAGLRPQTIFDVGAADGTPALQSAFPEVPQVLIEPLEEFHAALATLASQQPNIRVIPAAAGSTAGNMIINVRKSGLYGTSMFDEPGVESTARTVPVVTLDDLVAEHGLAGPFLVKIDVEGAELDVLRGAASALAATEAVIMETSLIQHRTGVPLLDETLRFMSEHGFAVYDLVGFEYRPLDNALSRLDVVFVKSGSVLLQDKRYETPEQRARRLGR